MAGLLRDRYEVYFAVTDTVLEELVESQGYRTVRIRSGLGMRDTYPTI